MSPSSTRPPVPLSDALPHAAGLSRFLARMLDSRPWLRDRLQASLDSVLDAEAMRAFIAAQEAQAGSAELALRPALRHLRTWVLCHLVVRDLCGRADLTEVTETMTVLAEVAVRHAHDVLRAALVQRYGLPLPRPGGGGAEEDPLTAGDDDGGDGDADGGGDGGGSGGVAGGSGGGGDGGGGGGQTLCLPAPALLRPAADQHGMQTHRRPPPPAAEPV